MSTVYGALIPRKDLRALARARLKDARILQDAKRYDCAAYVCGYAVELALKARICRTLKWPGYPETRKEFDGLRSFKVHDLSLLLHLSGVERKIKQQHFAPWSTVLNNWATSMRYRPVGGTTPALAGNMIEAAKAILGATK